MSRSSSDRIKPQASSHCPSAGSSNAPSLGSAAADAWLRTGNASTTRPSPSCASPPSASCCENYAIPHDVLGQTLRRLIFGYQLRNEEVAMANQTDWIPRGFERLPLFYYVKDLGLLCLLGWAALPARRGSKTSAP